jgi:hypothetical protein
MIEIRPAVEDDVAAMEVIGRVTWPESVWMEPDGAPGD